MPPINVFVVICAIGLVGVCVVANEGVGIGLGDRWSALNEETVYLNIHVKLDAQTEKVVEDYDNHIHAMAPHDDIFLRTINEGHVTVYLSEFNASHVNSIASAIESKKESFDRFSMRAKTAFVQGDYGMWEVEVAKELQFISDTIVNATQMYIIPNQSVPSWVYDLPEPERSKKIAYIKEFGSPNVFDEFQPHITLAWDNYPGENLTSVFEELDIKPTESQVSVIALGSVGSHGTVLRGKDYALFIIPESSDSSSHSHTSFVWIEVSIVSAVVFLCVLVLCVACCVWIGIVVLKKVNVRREGKSGTGWLEDAPNEEFGSHVQTVYSEESPLVRGAETEKGGEPGALLASALDSRNDDDHEEDDEKEKVVLIY